ncbi:DUF4158 domain-containing protein [Nonomuraea sp. NPDC000554]|uniref:DUF4158 domain-containing protein n=1 Tax=Nonomuraea sp. NPDC000554 TaxID=3154259 RepID=UPI0033344D8C
MWLKFFPQHSRFPEGRSELPDEAVAFVAAQVKVPATELSLFDWQGRTAECHRAQIRTFLDFSECTVADVERLTHWLKMTRAALVGAIPMHRGSRGGLGRSFAHLRRTTRPSAGPYAAPLGTALVALAVLWACAHLATDASGLTHERICECRLGCTFATHGSSCSTLPNACFCGTGRTG